MEAIKLTNINAFTEEKQLLHIDSLTIKRGERVLIVGPSGAGKSTLLKTLGDTYHDFELNGTCIIDGIDKSHSVDVAIQSIGYVKQAAEEQLMFEYVWQELAFPLENRQMDVEVMRSRIAEITNYFGITELVNRQVNDLSGGQRQLINVAAACMHEPSILILDEPTSQLDIIATQQLMDMLKRLHDDFGMTIIIVEHQLEGIVEHMDRYIYLEAGEIVIDQPISAIGQLQQTPLKQALPTATQLFLHLKRQGRIPLTTGALVPYVTTMQLRDGEIGNSLVKEPILQLKNISFRYGKTLPDVIQEQTLTVHKGEFFTILGGNGSGKTTLLKIMARMLKNYEGSVAFENKKVNSPFYECAYLPQNPQDVFLLDSVQKDLVAFAKSYYHEQAFEMVDQLLKDFELQHLQSAKITDLSGGEKQLLAIAKLCLKRPKLLLLDEPTKGLDIQFKMRLQQLLQQLQSEGMTIVAVTHDLNFAAEISNTCAMCFEKRLIAVLPVEEFFANNFYYTTAAQRIARKMNGTAITTQQLLERTKEIQR